MTKPGLERRRPEVIGARSGYEKPLSGKMMLLLVAIHVAIAISFKYSSWLATLHALGTLGAAVFWGTDPKKPGMTLMAITYVAGCEVLWRMANQPPFLTWEFGKQVVILVICVAMARRSNFGRAWGPWLYLLLLTPGVLITLVSRDFSSSRQLLSADMSGPLAIALCLAYFLGLNFQHASILNSFLVAIPPIAGIAFLCYSSSFGSDDIVFGDSSNFAASGGFGPNQVSGSLAFGILCVWFGVTSGLMPGWFRIVFAPLALWFAVQSALTFSRTGIYLSAVSCLAASLPMFRSLKSALVACSTAGCLVLLFVYVLFPFADAFTGGKLSSRFEKVEGSGRESIIMADFGIWANHPVLGAGVGLSYQERRAFLGGHAAKSHTEYTRLLAEHGILGLVAGILLFWILGRAALSATGTFGRGVSVGCLVFGMLFMAASATRLALPAVTFALVVTSLRRRGQLATSRTRRMKARPLGPFPKATAITCTDAGDSLNHRVFPIEPNLAVQLP